MYIGTSLFAVFAFAPLFSSNGKHYLPLIIYQFAISNNIETGTTFPISMIIPAVATIISMVIFLFINKCKLIIGDNLLSMLLLFLSFIASYVYNIARERIDSFSGLLYIIFTLAILVLSIILSSILGRKESLQYLCKTLIIFSLLLSIETYIQLALNGKIGFASDDFTLGWGDKSTVSSLLLLTFPFYSILFVEKKYYISPLLLLSISTIILLSSYSSILGIIVFIIPLIVLSFKNSGKRYPYLMLLFTLIAGSITCLLVFFNAQAKENVLIAIKSINPFTESIENRLDTYKDCFNQFMQNPILGVSLFNRYNIATKELLLPKNGLLTSAVLGGSFGIIFYIGSIINTFIVVIKKQAKEKNQILIFLLILLLIGSIDIGLYSLPIFMLFTVVNVVYQMSNRENDAIIHMEYFENRERKLNR